MNLTIGGVYTMSRSKDRSNDGSWSHSLWRVEAANATHAVIIDPAPRYPDSFGSEPMLVEVSRFDWTPAEPLVDALRRK